MTFSPLSQTKQKMFSPPSPLFSLLHLLLNRITDLYTGATSNPPRAPPTQPAPTTTDAPCPHHHRRTTTTDGLQRFAIKRAHTRSRKARFFHGISELWICWAKHYAILLLWCEVTFEDLLNSNKHW